MYLDYPRFYWNCGGNFSLFRLTNSLLACGKSVGSIRTLCISLSNLKSDTADAMCQAASQGVWN